MSHDRNAGSDDSANRKWFHPGIQVSFARSNYAACFGTGGMAFDTLGTWVNDSFRSPNSNMDTDGAFRCVKARKFQNFTGGTSKTALASELIAGLADGRPFPSWRSRP